VTFSLTRQIGKKRLRRHVTVLVVVVVVVVVFVVVEVFVLVAADTMELPAVFPIAACSRLFPGFASLASPFGRKACPFPPS
jgi:hypothetical protein